MIASNIPPTLPVIIREYKQVNPSISDFSKKIDCEESRFEVNPTIKNWGDCIWDIIDEYSKNKQGSTTTSTSVSSSAVSGTSISSTTTLPYLR